MEIWKQIEIDDKIYDYEVSTLGNVRNRTTGKIIKQYDNGHGYLKVVLYKNGKRKNFKVHRLVANAFIPNPDNLPEVDHIDRNRQNNCVENLRWATRQGNIDNTDQSGKSKRVRCVETGVIYDSTKEVERQTGLNHGNIVKCCKGERKTTGGFHWEYVD